MNNCTKSVLFMLAAMTLSAAGASGQTQTADGAQQFLQTVITSNKAGVSVFKPGVQVMRRSQGETFPVQLDMYAKKATLVPDPRSACASMVHGAVLDPAKYNLTDGGVAEIRWVWYSFAPGTTPPPSDYAINWGKVRIERGAFASFMTMGGTVTTEGPYSNAVSVITGDGTRLQFTVDDPDLLDRVEYAMKFLAKSCDVTVGTGF